MPDDLFDLTGKNAVVIASPEVGARHELAEEVRAYTAGAFIKIDGGAVWSS